MTMVWKKKHDLKTIEEIIEYNIEEDMDSFLYPKRDPYIKGLQEAVELVKDCIAKNMPVTIVGDYDCDGITSTSILYMTLYKMGVRAQARIPRRFSEGYGLKENIVDEINEGLMITVDNGISAVEAIQKAKDKGLTVIVMDHHLRREDGKLPPADVIVDPCAIEGSEFNDYCGAGLAYRFAKMMLPDHPILPKLEVLASIGTVADVMKLRGDNRNIVIEGLKHMNDRDVTSGLGVLMDELALEHVDEGDYGFKLGPICNAAGRLHDKGAKAVYLLLASNIKPGGARYWTDYNYLKDLAHMLIDCNDKRKADVKEAVKVAESIITKNELQNKKPIVIYDPSFSEGIVGIIAGHIAEKYRTPCLVFTDSKDPDVLKGSGRSYEGVHLKKLLDTAKDCFVGYGGHAGAAGMSVKRDKLQKLCNTLEAGLRGYDFSPADVLYYDLEISAKEVGEYVKHVNQYAPYGEGNPKIVFKINKFPIMPKGKDHFAKRMGEDKQHLKFISYDTTAVAFDQAKKWDDMGQPLDIDIIGTLSQNHFAGNVTDQIEIIDMRPSPGPEKTELYKQLEKMFTFV